MADPISGAYVALKAGSALAEGMQGRAQNLNEAAKADAQAKLADTQALQRDTAARDELERFIGSMRVARASSGMSLNSPNAIVLEQDSRNTSDDQRLRNRADDRQRAANFRAAAKSYKSAAKYSMVTGIAKAGMSIAQYNM